MTYNPNENVKEDVSTEEFDDIVEIDNPALLNDMEPSDDTESEEAKPVKAKAFVESSVRADDMKSSGLAFMVVGILMIGFAALVYLGIVPMGVTPTQKTLNSVIILALSLLFIAVSVYSNKKAKDLDKKSISETKLTEEIIQYCVENYIEPVLSEEDLEHREEETYFAREQHIRQLINSEYKGLSESYIDYLLDNIYSELFEDESNE